MVHVAVPTLSGSVQEIVFAEPASLDTGTSPFVSRVAYAAAHVVTDLDDLGSPRIDWDSSLALRHRLWAMGLGVAESMDTSQRGMGLSPSDALELGERTLKEARAVDGLVVVGVGTDDLPPGPAPMEQIRDAYLAQITRVEDAGGQAVMMASRQLAATATTPQDYLDLYDAVISQCRAPVVLHWLGVMFDPSLEGYWGASTPPAAIDTIIDLIASHPTKVAGIKVSVLDASVETALRERMPKGVLTFTGDDYHYVDLIAGDDSGHSHALLGAFAAVAPFASAALRRLDSGDDQGFRDILGPTERLSQLIFAAPTQYYKVGIAWLSYLDGLQEHFRMLEHFESNRSMAHLGELVVQANNIGYFRDPDLTAARVRAYFATPGTA